jgi:hypothetical protein
MVYLSKMVNLSMAMLNNQMVYHVISSPLKYWLEPGWRHVIGIPPTGNFKPTRNRGSKKIMESLKSDPIFFSPPVDGFIQGNNVSMGPWVSHDYWWPEPFNHIFRGVPLEIPHKMSPPSNIEHRWCPPPAQETQPVAKLIWKYGSDSNANGQLISFNTIWI